MPAADNKKNNKPKKTAIKKAVSKKSVRKKVTTRKTVTKSTSKPSLKSTDKKKNTEPVLKTKIAKNEVQDVNLPQNASVRMIEKAGVLQVELDKYIKSSFIKVAYVSGLCFILVGWAYASSNLHLLSVATNNLAQSLDAVQQEGPISGDSTDVQGQTEPIKDPIFNEPETVTEPQQTTDPVAYPPPIFEIITQAPKVTDNHFSFVFSVTNVSSVDLKIKNLDTGKLMPPVILESKSGDKYRAEIPAETYPDALYQIFVYVKPLDSTLGERVYSQRFEVKTAESGGGSDTVVIEEEVDPEVAETAGDNEEITPIVSEEESETLLTEVEADKIDSSGSDNFEVRIKAPDDELSGVVQIELRMPSLLGRAELYARPVNSLQSKFLTSAVKKQDNWLFILDTTTTLPNGSYEMYAVAKGEMTQTSNSIFLKVLNPVQYSPVPQMPMVSVEETAGTDPQPEVGQVSAVPTFNPTVEPIKPPRDFVEITPEPTPTSSPYLKTVDSTRVYKEVITTNTDSLNKILKNLAAAEQSGDEILIKAAKEELRNKRREIVSDTLRDEKLRDEADDIDRELEIKFADLEKKVETFERLRRDKSEGSTALDTDKDGISDFDEINIYNTNPNSPDSDNDGFNDGIEIVRGYDPTSDEPEAIVKFESPKENKLLTRDDVLQVEEILPIVDVNVGEGTTSPLATEIRGKGLPNSFMTLFIFSQPTVVTIKTDEDGKFVYTFDKELEDGEHEIYVAVTDNTGDIIAQSSAFSFIKTAQAFTPIDASEGVVISADSDISSSGNTYGIVAGMGLLALGLVLVMLGVGLRTKDEDIVLVGEASDNSNFENQS